jgi:hypothetical protein
VTNVPATLLSLRAGLVLGRVRRQIELVFKRWKSVCQLAAWRSAAPWRILCEGYEKLIGLVLQHWLAVIGCWSVVNRSLVKAAQTVQGRALGPVLALEHAARLSAALGVLLRCLRAGCRTNTRAKQPNTYQLLLNPDLLTLA